MPKVFWILVIILLVTTALYGLGGAIAWCISTSVGILIWSLIKILRRYLASRFI